MLFRSKSRSKTKPQPYPYVYSYEVPHSHGSQPRYTYSYLPTHTHDSLHPQMSDVPSPPSSLRRSSSSSSSAPSRVHTQPAEDLVPRLLNLHAKALSLGRLIAHLRLTQTHLPQAPPSLRLEVRQLTFDVETLRAHAVAALGTDARPPEDPLVKELLMRTFFLCATLDIGEDEWAAIRDWVMDRWYAELDRWEREIGLLAEEWTALGRQIEWERVVGVGGGVGSGDGGEFRRRTGWLGGSGGGVIGRRIKTIEKKRAEVGRELVAGLEAWEDEVVRLYERVRVECP